MFIYVNSAAPLLRTLDCCLTSTFWDTSVLRILVCCVKLLFVWMTVHMFAYDLCTKDFILMGFVFVFISVMLLPADLRVEELLLFVFLVC